MTYVEGFVVAVPTANREDYLRHAAGALPLFREFGVTRMVEAWGNDVPDGVVTDFRGAVQATADETVVFSWFEYPSRAARDAATAKMMADPRMEEMGASMPFDGKRMIMGGFDSFVDEGEGRGVYVDGFVLPVEAGKREAYARLAATAAPVFREHGAVRVVEAWGDDVPRGKVTDYYRAVKAAEAESIVYSWIEWPSKAARDAGWAKVMADPRMQPDHDAMPFDPKRMFWGGFEMLLDSAGEGEAE
jgi:uncharacterized protein YbaA (DUF1428 family)